VIVTTPQDLSLQDVRKSINFCKHLNIPVLGVIENMSGLVCPHCGKLVEVFKSGGGEAMAKDMGVPFLGRIPIEPQIVGASDEGKPFVYFYRETQAAQAFIRAIQPVLDLQEQSKPAPDRIFRIPKSKKEKEMKTMKIAIPTVAGVLCQHFGHCEQFALCDVDAENKTILKTTMVVPPPHEPGLLPTWLHEQGVNVIIAGGMGSRAQELFLGKCIHVVTGASPEAPEKIVGQYLRGELATGSNVCDH
jgi:predicted Fe-Mo cluster-binding NifX family protein